MKKRTLKKFDVTSVVNYPELVDVALDENVNATSSEREHLADELNECLLNSDLTWGGIEHAIVTPAQFFGAISIEDTNKRLVEEMKKIVRANKVKYIAL